MLFWLQNFAGPRSTASWSSEIKQKARVTVTPEEDSAWHNWIDGHGHDPRTFFFTCLAPHLLWTLTEGESRCPRALDLR